jgi:hypothetical protein
MTASRGIEEDLGACGATGGPSSSQRKVSSSLRRWFYMKMLKMYQLDKNQHSPEYTILSSPNVLPSVLIHQKIHLLASYILLSDA